MVKNDEVAEKDGYCPINDSFGHCMMGCFDDAECEGTMKCCSNGCGFECKEPVKVIGF